MIYLFFCATADEIVNGR